MNCTRGHPIKLKAVLISDDGGKTWTCDRQYYLTDVTANRFLSDLMQGKRFAMIKEDANGYFDRDKASA